MQDISMSTEICVSPKLECDFTPNHWSNEQKTKEHIEKIILPYVSEKHKPHGKLKVPPNCTDCLLEDKFQKWYSEDAYNYIKGKDSMVKNGFKAAGIADIIRKVL